MLGVMVCYAVRHAIASEHVLSSLANTSCLIWLHTH